MAQKIKTWEIDIVDKGGAFHSFFRKLSGDAQEFDFEGITSLRRLLSNERARMLHVLKSKHPRSLYELAKILKRDFKSVSDDIKLLERFGLVEMASEKTGKRERLRPLLAADGITLHIKL